MGQMESQGGSPFSGRIPVSSAKVKINLDLKMQSCIFPSSL